MPVLDETDLLILEHHYESVTLKEKATGKVLFEDDLYGEPGCGLIDKNHRWAMIAGESLIVWTPDRIERIDHAEIKWVHAIRVKTPEIVEFLVDPWSEYAAVWEVNPMTFEFNKIRGFDTYKDREYVDMVVW
ncbi:hypothetical protein [Desulfuromonas acetoxidans]|uniref:hypothetical protein n=1 Tax=Desulfuromonas acetoxidans TaxID=891 RepID=UPI00292E5D86|nr:hypothetical protein [Desulfuromonas acetoxidans]